MPAKTSGAMISVKKIAIPVFCLLTLFGFEYLGFLSGMNNYFYDLAFRLRGPEKPPPSIVIVAIDEETLAKLGPWPLKRRYYAAALEKMKAADVVGFDIVMADASPDDPILAKALKQRGASVLPIIINEGLSIEVPSRTLSHDAAGHVHIERGIDGVAREVFHTISFRGQRLPSFSSVISDLAGRRSSARGVHAGEERAERGIGQSDLMRINYYGGPGSFPRISFLDVVQGTYPAGYFQGKIVLIGITAMGLVDSSMTPFAETRLGVSGVEIQANIVSNLLREESIRAVPLVLRWIIGLTVALLLYLAFFRMTEGAAVLLLIAALILYSLSTFYVFSQHHVWNAPAATLISFTILLALAYIFKLQAAAGHLGVTYQAILPHLRNEHTSGKSKPVSNGLAGILTPKGIQNQALMLHDITRQLIFEKELSDRILLSDLFGVAVFDPEGRLVIANRDILQLCTDNAISLDGRERFIAELSLHIQEKGKESRFSETGPQSGTFSATIFVSKPVKRYLKVDLSHLIVADQPYAFFILADITKIKELEILKSQIVSIVSHELKTPMTNIHGFSEFLVDTLEGESQQFASIILEESVRLTKFVNTFLDINRIEDGRQQIRKNSVELSSLVEQAAVKMQPIAKNKNIQLSAEAPGGSVSVMIDRDLTEQAVLNLAENAVKYSPPDSRVIIRLVDLPDAVRIDVSDNGYGIREEDQERIFDKFYRANVETAEDVKGSGLGLAFVKEAIEAQGGDVKVTSTFGQGATFSIIFPRASSETA